MIPVSITGKIEREDNYGVHVFVVELIETA
jgi:hypothetical protein